ncbi:MAG TPA: phosphoribosylformylglycinamidine synthase [Clostridiales bacterium]|jgi:phosphoribosylformylglycinamidine synthase|nr:phosphoribosylformylglycinamidine synthase [Clostridiales bacterium]
MTNKIYRTYVEKHEGFDVESSNLYREIMSQLNIQGLSGIRVIHRYDCSGIDEATYEAAKNTIFGEVGDKVFTEFDYSGNCLIREYQPGMYDQRADSASQCIKMLSPKSNPIVKCATVFVFLGEINASEYEMLKRYLINPVETREGRKELPDSLEDIAPEPPQVKVLDGFTDMSQADRERFVKDYGLAMSLDDLKFIQDYFISKKRNPTITEIRVLDTYWSDHCRHTTFNTVIDDVKFSGAYSEQIEKAYQEYLQAREFYYGERADQRPVTLMDIATICAKVLKREGVLDDLDESEEINACSIVVDADVEGKTEQYLVMFKNETHNHPTEIEPFGGAATCLGGAIRDPLSGRAYVYQAMRVTGCGNPNTPYYETLNGKLPQRVITTQAAAGYSSYGNQIGLATGLVSEIYHEGYVAKRMEIGAVIACAKRENVKRSRPEAGDVVLLVGGRTGRDGCGGATGSSKAHDISSLEECSAEVQKGNPIIERKIQRLFRHPECARLIKRCNDFGAGGVSVAVGELTDGILIDLDAVPKKYQGLDGTELAISESQERMAVVVAEADVEKFREFCAKENVECTQIATVTDDNRMRMLWRGKTIVDLERAFLNTNGVAQHIKVEVASGEIKNNCGCEAKSVKEKLYSTLEKLNSCSQRGLIERFDSTVGANTVLLPLGGKYQRTPMQVMAARLPIGETNTGTLMSYGFDPYLSEQNPFFGAIYAVMESVLRIACAGGDAKRVRLTFQEYFEKLLKDPKKWGKPFMALLGAFTAQRRLNVAAIGGKDSMSGSFLDLNVPPTLVSFAVAPVDIRNVISSELKRKGNKLYLLKTEYKDNMPDFDKFNAMCQKLYEGIRNQKIVSARTVEPDGVLPTLSRMAFGNMLGVELNEGFDLFAPNRLSVIIETEGDFEGGILLGQVTDTRQIVVSGEVIPLDEAYSHYIATLESVFSTANLSEAKVEPATPCSIRNTKRTGVKIAKPKVFIPVFPGTNCEYESILAFERAGGRVDNFVFKNLFDGDIEYSIDALKKHIDDSQIIMLPGGFSAGDEPNGSGKFIATVFRSEKIKDAINEFLYKRDGLMLGICNGFQALIKLGLVPFGEIGADGGEEFPPTLTFNAIGRHQSRVVRTKITSVLSPWFSKLNTGDIVSVAISHGEGRFVCSEEMYKQLEKNGQIATQYVDFEGRPSMNYDFNPSGSFMAVEAITSKDGRILGKMGHTERYENGLFKNVEGNFDLSIFSAGIEYFG